MRPLALLPLLFPSFSTAAPPAINYIKGNLTTPSASDSYFQTADPSQARTDYVYTEAAPRREVVALARGLGANVISQSEYTLRAYRYVLNNVRTEYRYGLSKGAAGAVVDKSGTPFDQADLLFQLLTLGGVSAHLEHGLATLTGAQFSSWTGITAAKSACRLFANGGIPAVVNGSTLADCSYNTTDVVTSISFNQLTVVVGFKAISFPGEAGLVTKMGCTTECGTAARTALLQGATQVAGTTPYAQTLNTTAMDTQVRSYATSLQNNLMINQVGSDVEEIVGAPKVMIDHNASLASVTYSFTVK
jgi:hypothetical protein